MDHQPVLLDQVMTVLAPRKGETVLDVTVGLGGHAGEFLSHVGVRGKIIGLDADARNLAASRQRLPQGNVVLHHANFRALVSLGLPPCDVLFADLGLSSPHIDDPERGFSFRTDGPLDCRYDSSGGRSAADLLSGASVGELVDIFQRFGEVPRVAALAKAVVTARGREPLQRTGDLVRVVERVYGWQAQKLLPQIFQALRIAVNDEIGSLERFLLDAPGLLRSGGRLGIISYHSLEDRLVKSTFRSLTTGDIHPVDGREITAPPFRLLTEDAVRPSPEEILANRRARSARFRAIIRQNA